jgi:hypothetical protein
LEYGVYLFRELVEGVLNKAAKVTGKDLDEDIGPYYFNAG